MIFHVFFLFLHFFSCEIINPHSVIEKEDYRTLSKDEIYIYQFNTDNTQALFFIYNIQGDALSYGYFSMDVTNLEITERDLVKMNYMEVLEKPKVVGKQSFLSIRLDKYNNVEDKDQEILILFCPNEKGCTYRLIFSDNKSLIQLKEKEKLSLQIKGFQSWPLDLSTIKERDNAILTVSIESYVLFQNIFMSYTFWNKTGTEPVINTKQIIPAFNLSSTKTFFSVPISKEDAINNNYTVNISVDSSKEGFYTISFETDHTDDIILTSDISEIYELYYNKPKNFIVKDYSFTEKVPIEFHLKPQNCFVKLEQIENGEVVSEYKGDFIQFTLNDIKDYTFRTSIDHYEDESFKNENTFCSINTYLFQKTNMKQVIIAEGVDYTMNFNEGNKKILFQLPFVYQEQLRKVPFPFYATVRVNNGAKISMKTYYEGKGTYGTITYTIIDNELITLDNNYLTFCTEDEICNYIIELESLTPEIECTVSFKISVNGKVPTFIKKNEFLYDGVYNGDSNYYTRVFPGEKGTIELNHINGALKFTAKVINLNVQKKIYNQYKVMGKITKPYLEKQTFQNVIEYNVNSSCIENCYLYISIKEVNNFAINEQPRMFLLNVRNNKNTVKSPVNHLISGDLLHIGDTYSYTFTLSKKIKKVQIIMKGKGALFSIKLSYKEQSFEYEPLSETLFIDYDIEVDTSDYNVNIEIVVRAKEIEKYNNAYSMKVIPFEHLQYPIHYITGNREIETYTGKDHNKVYLIYKVSNSTNNEYTLYAYDKANLGYNFTIKKYIVSSKEIAKKYQEQWDEYFNKATQEINDKIDGNTFSFNKDGANYFFFVIESEQLDQKINVRFTSSIYTPDLDNIVSRIPSLYILNPSYSNPAKLSFYNYADDSIDTVTIKTLSGENKISLRNQVIAITTDTVHFIMQNVYAYLSILTEKSLVKTDHILKDVYAENYEFMNINTMETLVTNNLSYPFNLTFDISNFTGKYTQNYKIDRKYLVDDNYTQLFIKAYYTDSSFSQKDSEGIEIKELPFEQTFMVFGTITTKKYSYLVVQVSTKGEGKYEYWGLSIRSSTQPELYKYQVLSPRKYFYDVIDNNNASLYLLKKQESLDSIVVEFASCSNDTFTIEFYDFEKDSPLNFTTGESSGRFYYTIKNEGIKSYIKMSVKLEKVSEFNNSTSFFMLKYMYIEYSRPYTFYDISSPIQTSYSSTNNNMSISWGGMHNANNYVKPTYYLSFYDKNKVKAAQKSICSVFNSDYNETLYDTNQTTWINANNDKFKYEISVVGYYVDKSTQEEFFVSFGSSVEEGGSSNMIMWVVVIFGVLLVIIGYVTYLIYKQVKIKGEEDEDESNIEIYEHEQMEEHEGNENAVGINDFN